MASSLVCNSVSLYTGLNSKYTTRAHRILDRSAANVGPNPTRPDALVGENGLLSESEKNRTTVNTPQKLEPLWDDGFGSVSVKDYVDESKKIIRPDGGPPRWFCPVECGRPLEDSPVLLFLPGIDGTGMCMILHHKPLGRVFEVRCLHIPIYDRTPFEALVKLVEETVRLEHASSPRKPIYLVGDSLGGCLALAVAARNPTIDLVLILSNPATSFGRSHLQPVLTALEAMPEELLMHFALPYLLTFAISEPTKLMTAAIDKSLPLRNQLGQLYGNFISLSFHLPDLIEIMPRETLLWKLKMLKTAASYVDSRLHAVEAEVLVLASGKDNVLPSTDEAQRLKNSIKKCRVRMFNNNGHTLLLEEGISLLRVIKGTGIYRRSWKHDFVSDFFPPSNQERKVIREKLWFAHNALHPVTLSTLEDRKVVRGLAGVPSEGPVLLVGNHLLAGLELISLFDAFLCEKKITLRGLAHPALFTEKLAALSFDLYITDWIRVFGAAPVTGSNLIKLMSTKSHALLYPGGTRAGLHHRGEEHKLFWPDQPEFVRVAAKFGATIVPFAVVGEDDLAKSVLDYNDLMKIPVVNDYVREFSRDTRRQSRCESGDQELFFPIFVPKIVPGRLYFLFGKPIETRGREEILQDRDSANEVYLQIKNIVEHNVSYLLRKREEDPFRNSLERLVYRLSGPPGRIVPTFEI